VPSAQSQTPSLAPLVLVVDDSSTVRRVTQRLLEEADRLYHRAEHGIALLPADVRPAIWAARRIYAEIGAQTRRNGLDSVTRRAVVSKRRKLALVASAMVSSLIARKGTPHPPSAEAADLVRIASDGAREQPDRSFSARLIRAVELFQRLREAEQGGFAASPDKAV
jgi:phytoene synthase